MISFAAPVWLWPTDRGGWHFVTVPEPQSAEIRLEAAANGPRAGFGSVRVVARLGEVEWRTSLFPDSRSGGYLLPVKAEVRRRASIAEGDTIRVVLEVA